MSEPFCVLAIDIGSSSLRVGLFTAQGEPLGECVRRHYALDTTPNGEATLDAERIFAYLFSALDEVHAGLAAHCRVKTVGISTFWHSLTGIDAQQETTLPIITWADSRAAHEAAALKYSGVARHLHALTGCPAHSSFWPARLRWLANKQQAAFARTRHWLSLSDLLFLRLFGTLSTSLSMASGTGLLDSNRRCWSPLAMSLAHVKVERLPDISDAPCQGLRSPWAARWPAFAAIPWYPAWGDGACSNIGAGAHDAQALVLMLGTSGSLRRVWRGEKMMLSDGGLWCYRIDGQRFAGGMALSEGGNAAAWARRFLTAAADEDLDRQAAAMAPAAHGLTVLPYFLGARSPEWSEERTAAILGITAATGPAEIYRATLESVGLRFASLKQRLDSAWPGQRQLIATGGGFLQSRIWAQIVADCLGEPLSVSAIEEGSLRGAALLVLEKYIDIRGIASPIARVVEPDLRAHEIYQYAKRRQLDYDNAIIQTLKRRLEELE
ncbi:gluconokinase [Sodalis praecaptivus]|uniref:gluconokinase n=1 Tax=Sodalis praecaptivus TaxID=1239307 RepID=UPI0027FF0D83|nr:gluconokinase [Sodalis praecaptivus]CAJ0995659.1 Xylulose kinase [Sodalis praecaptivus]